MKKHLAQGHELKRDDLIKELGDVAWYFAETATALDVDLEEVLRRNIEKLKARYPEGFDKKRSIHREDGPVSSEVWEQIKQAVRLEMSLSDIQYKTWIAHSE